ncbi:MAG: ATP-binding protein [Isosphaeraceae bacterium]
MLLDDPETPEALRPSLARIRRNAEIEARLIDDLLDLTRGRQGRLYMSPAVVDAHAVIRQAVEVCEVDLRARGLDLELDLAAEECHLWFDPARLQQVVWNLLKNAVKFSHPGGTVAVRTRTLERDGGPARLVVEVVDQGVGIDAALLPRVFDPFEQGDSETARRSGGLGLGLAICREIVEAHGGTIAASSPGKGRGASLRVEVETVAEPSEPAPALALAPVEDDAGRPMLRVLLVEDNYDSREAVSRILSAQGFAIQTAGDVRTAIALADATSFDIVVSDIGLPDGSGLDLMRTPRRREGPRSPASPSAATAPTRTSARAWRPASSAT